MYPSSCWSCIVRSTTIDDELDEDRSYNNTHTQPLNGPLSGTSRVSRYQKGKTNLDFSEARDSEWQWHQLGHMQVCTSLQTDNHASTPPLSFYRPDALPATQPTVSKHWRHIIQNSKLSASIRQILERNTVLPLISAHLNVYQMQFYCDKLPNNKCIGPQAAGMKCIRPRWTLVLPPWDKKR